MFREHLKDRRDFPRLTFVSPKARVVAECLPQPGAADRAKNLAAVRAGAARKRLSHQKGSF